MKHLCTLTALLLATLGAMAQQTALPADGFVVLPYMQYSTQTSMTILWETRDRAASVVEYGEARLGDKQANLSQKATLEGTRQFHEVPLDNLKPETNYFWRVVSKTESGVELTSTTYSFKTAVLDTSAYMFALIGDTQRNNDTPWGWSVIAKQIWRKRPSFVVLAGDLVDWGPRKEDWTEHFFPGGQALMARVPLFSVLGNHEGDADFYYQYMKNPKPEYYYSFKYGNAEFFMIDTNRDVSENSEQYNWLEQALAKSTALWKFVVHHHPPYSSDSDDHGDTYKSLSTLGTHARNLVPLFDKYGVDFCLFGHTHLYERSWPLKDNRINQAQGTIYINSGGAGGYTEAFAPTRSWFTLEQREGHHFCTFAIFDKTLVFKAIDYEGQVFDAFEMQKKDNQTTASVVLPPAPVITCDKYAFEKTTTATLEAGLANLTIYYTLDGSEPTRNSSRYAAPFTISDACTLKARAFTADGRASRVSSRVFEKMKPVAAQKVGKTTSGLTYSYYEGDWRELKAGFFAATPPKRNGMMRVLSLDEFEPMTAPYWGFVAEGYLEIAATDTYTFYALNSRGLEVTIGDQVLNVPHRDEQFTKSLVLEKGHHRFVIRSLQESGRKNFGFGFFDRTNGRTPISPFQLSH